MMRGNDVMGILFAYVHEERVRELTRVRVMASIPFAGRYRLVDFPLSNFVNAGINKVGVITEQNYQSLMDHLGSGKAWDLSRKREGLYLLPPFGAETARTEGKISSLGSIMTFLNASHEEYVLLSDCDTAINIDYREMFSLHDSTRADVTVVYCHGQSPNTDKNVLYSFDENGRVNDMLVKRGGDPDCNYGLGMYLMKRSKLIELVRDCMNRNLQDFDRDLLMRNMKSLKIYGYEFKGVHFTVDSLSSYFHANLALTDPAVREQLFLSSRPIYTKVRDDMPARYGLGCDVVNSLVADGCLIEGEVENCILFRGVHIGKGASVKNCVIMQDTVVGTNTRLDYVVADKEVVFENDRTMMGYQTYPVYVAKGNRV